MKAIFFNLRVKTNFPTIETQTSFDKLKFSFPVKRKQIDLIKIKKLHGFVGKDFDSMYRIKVRIHANFDSKFLSASKLTEKLSDKTFVLCSNCFKLNNNEHTGDLSSVHYCGNCGKQLIR